MHATSPVPAITMLSDGVVAQISVLNIHVEHVDQANRHINLTIGLPSEILEHAVIS